MENIMSVYSYFPLKITENMRYRFPDVIPTVTVRTRTRELFVFCEYFVITASFSAALYFLFLSLV